MNRSPVLVFLACLYSALAYDINYPNSPYIEVQCEDAQPQNYTRIGDYFYLIGTEKVSWFEAAHICRKSGGDLALIESSNEMNAISNHLEKHDKDSWFWISGNDLITVHNFMSLTNGLPLKFTSWSKGQPDFPGKERCVHLWYREAAFKMNNWMCNEKAKYICQRHNYTRCRDVY